MSSIPAKVVAMEERACEYQVVVQITNKYRGSFNTLGIRSRNGKNRTLRPSKDSSSLKKRSRMRLQLVLRGDWHGNTGWLVAQDLALLTKVRTLIHEEISLLTVLKIPFRERTPNRRAVLGNTPHARD